MTAPPITEPVEIRPIPGFDGYFADSNGRIHGPRKVVRISCNAMGYPQITIKGKTMLVHPLVALTFHGPRPNGHWIDHLDSDKTNNAPSNLEYVTPSENSKRTFSRGRSRGVFEKGERHRFAKLSASSAREIASLRWASHADVVAKKYGVTTDVINRIWSGREWSSETGFEKIRLRHFGKLKPQDVEKIRSIHSSGVSYLVIAKDFGVSPRYVHQVVALERRRLG